MWRFKKVSGMPSAANLRLMEPPDSSAARMPLPGAIREAAMNSRLVVRSGCVARVVSSVMVRVELRRECWTLRRARRRASFSE